MPLPFAVEQKILTFQFLSAAVRFAELGRAMCDTEAVEQCHAQMRETYDSALLLSTRISFTSDDCGAFDAGSSYVEESFLALRVRLETLRGQPVDAGVSPRHWLKEWEPMWRDPEPDGASSDIVFQAHAVRRHLKKIEDTAYSSILPRAGQASLHNQTTFVSGC